MLYFMFTWGFNIFMYIGCEEDFFRILKQEVVVKYLILTISGSIGMTISVPINIILYSIFNRRKITYKITSNNKLNGQRSLKL